MSRKFKLANGIIVEETPRDNTVTGENGYIDDYEVISCNDVDSFEDGEYICLSVNGGGMPTGGAFGSEFNVIEEIT